MQLFKHWELSADSITASVAYNLNGRQYIF